MGEPAATFGYSNVDPADKPRLVRGVFDRVAGRYDLMNDLMSGGVHRLWKDAAAARLNPQPGELIVDCAGGTGDMARRFSALAQAAANRRGGLPASVVVVDAVTDVALDLAALPDLARHEALLGTRLGNVRRELEALVARMATATVQPDRVPDAVRARWAEQRTTLTAAATQLTADIAAVRNAMHRSA